MKDFARQHTTYAHLSSCEEGVLVDITPYLQRRDEMRGKEIYVEVPPYEIEGFDIFMRHPDYGPEFVVESRQEATDLLTRAFCYGHEPCKKCCQTGKVTTSRRRGSCHRCRGKGYLTEADRERNAEYDESR